MQFVNLIKALQPSAKWALLLSIVVLQACSGGSGGGGSDREGQVASNNDGLPIYNGPPPANSEIQHFKTTFYDNLVSRCGSCHTREGGQTPFVDSSDINVAWAAAKTVANLISPPASAVVTKMDEGHNCWLSSNSSCAVNVTDYVANWAAGPNQSISSVNLTPIDPRANSGTLVAPASYTPNANPVLSLLRNYCVGCHTSSSSTPQSPFFASADNDTAYAAMLTKIDLANPANSRLVVRLQGSHNCWTPGTAGCASNATQMENAIATFAGTISPSGSLPAGMIATPGQQLIPDGIIASGGGRYDSDVIAKWEFREGQGTIATDTSGVQPEIVLQVFGSHSWFGGWGMRLSGGHLQASVSDSQKLYDRLAASGEYTIEAWIAPSNVTQQDAWIFGYAGGPNDRNLLLTQTLYNYDFYNRSSTNANPDAGPATSTADADEFAQATLQHVVMTYDAFNGRKIYVNGVDTMVTDAQGPGVFSNWNRLYALVIGSDFAGNDNWDGVVRMMAVHSRALDQSQIIQNYNVGVGQKFFLMFNVSQILNQPAACEEMVDSDNDGLLDKTIYYCYVVFEASQFDSSSYLFKEPRFVNFSPNAASNPLSFSLQGIYLGMNGRLLPVGQGFVNVDATFNGTSFTIDDAPMQQTGSIVPLENGPSADLFFLAFHNFDGQTGTTIVYPSGSYTNSYASGERSQIGMRTFDEINESFSFITGIAKDDPYTNATTSKTVADTFNTVRYSLPSTGDFQTYVASHQMAVMQLAASYCDALVENTSQRAAFFTDGVTPFNFATPVASVSVSDWQNKVVTPLVDRAFATGLDSQPTRAFDGDNDGNTALGTAHRDELIAALMTLITDSNNDTASERVPDTKADGLIYCNGTCPTGRTLDVVKAVCTATLSSASATVK